MANKCQTFLDEVSPLLTRTSSDWVKGVMADFDSFLIDHASCERKAVASAMSFLAKYPDRTAITEAMIALAREELDHYGRVIRLIHQRGYQPDHDRKDEYARILLAKARHGINERLLDRLIISGLIEARSCERLALVADALEPGGLKDFYWELARCEAGHYKLFFNLARVYFSEVDVKEAIAGLADVEAAAIASVEPGPRVH